MIEATRRWRWRWSFSNIAVDWRHDDEVSGILPTKTSRRWWVDDEAKLIFWMQIEATERRQRQMSRHRSYARCAARRWQMLNSLRTESLATLAFPQARRTAPQTPPPPPLPTICTRQTPSSHAAAVAATAAEVHRRRPTLPSIARQSHADVPRCSHCKTPRRRPKNVLCKRCASTPPRLRV